MGKTELRDRLYRAIPYIVGLIVGTIVIFAILMFVARHSGGKAQDQFSIICERMMHEGGRGVER